MSTEERKLAAIVSKNGFILGTFCVMDEEPRSISHEQLDGLRLSKRQKKSNRENY